MKRVVRERRELLADFGLGFGQEQRSGGQSRERQRTPFGRVAKHPEPRQAETVAVVRNHEDGPSAMHGMHRAESERLRLLGVDCFGEVERGGVRGLILREAEQLRGCSRMCEVAPRRD